MPSTCCTGTWVTDDDAHPGSARATLVTRRRVVVTGIGLQTPVGSRPEIVLAGLTRPRTAAATLAGLAGSGLPVDFAATITDPDPEPYCTARELRQMGRFAFLALAAGLDAVRMADVENTLPSRSGVFFGTGLGGLRQTAETVTTHHEPPYSVPAFTVTQIMNNAVAARLGIRLGVTGPALTYATACASGASAVGEAMLRIRHGDLDLAVAGGADAAVHPLVVASFSRMGVMSQRTAAPDRASRPFDADRDGLVLGEAAAFLVLEDAGHALARGATVLGEIAGYATNSDAHHIAAPRADGRTAADCMGLALADARLSAREIGHLNAHGTSTMHNDRAETEAILACFGPDGPPVTASKGVLGHSMGASGAVEAVVALLCAVRGVVPPVANHHAGDDSTSRLDVVSGAVRRIEPAPAISNSFGFGGHNVALVVAPY